MQDMVVPVGGKLAFNLVLISVVNLTVLTVSLPIFILMEQVIKGCVEEQEDIKRELQLPSIMVTMGVIQELATMQMGY